MGFYPIFFLFVWILVLHLFQNKLFNMEKSIKTFILLFIEWLIGPRISKSNFEDNIDYWANTDEGKEALADLRKFIFAQSELPVVKIGILEQLHAVNEKRSIEGFNMKLSDWSPMEWGCAIAGEAGELANLLKKQTRDNIHLTAEMSNEMADVIIYIDLLSSLLNINLPNVIAHRFNMISEKRRIDIKLPWPQHSDSAHFDTSKFKIKMPNAVPFPLATAHQNLISSLARDIFTCLNITGMSNRETATMIIKEYLKDAFEKGFREGQMHPTGSDLPNFTMLQSMKKHGILPDKEDESNA